MAEPQFRVLTPNGEPVTTIEAGANYIVNVTVDKNTQSRGRFFYRSVQALHFTERTRTADISQICRNGKQEAVPCKFRLPEGQGELNAQQMTYRIDLNQISFNDPAFKAVDNKYVLKVEWTYAAEEAPPPEEIEEGFISQENGEPFVGVPRVGSSDLNGAQATARPSPTTGTNDESSTSLDGSSLGNLIGVATGRPSGTATGSPRISEAPSKETDPSNQKAGGGSGGLSTGAKAGISVGAVLGVLAILALIFVCLRRRKSKRVTAGGYYGDAPGSSNNLREKEAGVGIAAIPLSASQSPASERNSHAAGDSASLGRGHSAKVVDGATMERGDGVGRHATTGHAAPAAVAAASGPVSRKPVHRNVSEEEAGTQRDGAASSQSQVLSDEERARWEEEERRLDEDIAEAERRRLA